MALIGRNGVGKTTVVNTILGLASLKGGQVRVADDLLPRPRTYMAAQRGVAVVPQGRCIVANLTVEENLLLGAATGRKGHWTVPRVYELFPILQERGAHAGHGLVRRPAADAGGRPRTDGQPQPDPAGRTHRRTGADQSSTSSGASSTTWPHIGRTALLLIEQNMTLVARVAARYCAMAKGAVVAEGRVDDESLEELHRHVMV